MKTYLVGGAVRDALLNRPIKDRDWVVVGSTPQQLLQQGFKAVGKDFPVFLHPKTGEEYALARTERKTSRGYHGFQFTTSPDVSLEEDLLRRDLTINAMAQDNQGDIIDPYGGQQDLKARLLRHVSPAFQEDPVRILRLARFQARLSSYGFQVAAETLQLMQDMVAAGEVDALVPERVWQETQSALTEAHPEQFFQVLRACGALEILFPELDRLFGIPQNPQWHPEIDCGEHTLLVLQQACQLSSAPEIRFAALTHDLGKGLTPQTDLPSHPGHEQRSRDLTTALCERLRIPNRYRQLAEHVASYHGHSHKAFKLSAESILAMFEAADAFRKPERFTQFLIACEADSRGRLGAEQQPYPQAPFLQQLLTECQQVDVQSIIRDGFQGVQIKEELHQRRLQKIQKQQKQLDIALQ